MASYPDWHEPVRMLADAVQPATPEQHGLAGQIGLTLRGDEPRTVASVLIEDHLRPAVWGADPDPATDRQRAFLGQLGGSSAGEATLTKTAASAWIEHYLTLRTIKELQRLRPEKNMPVIRRDVIDFDGVPTEILKYAVVSSVGSDGLIYFKGGNGQCSRPHKLVEAVDSDDPSDYPQFRAVDVAV